MNIRHPNPFPSLSTTSKVQFVPAGSNGTLICVILDESGSMNMCRNDTIGGFNSFVGKQKQQTDAGKAYLSLIKFESPHVKEVYKDVLVQDVPDLTPETYTPCGSTNLFDAIGKALTDTNILLEKYKQEERPSVLFLIMTDGEENASREYTNDMIKAMVAEAEKKDWTFSFLGANIDSFAVGATFGMRANNTVTYSTGKITETFDAVASSVSRIRSAKSAGLTNDMLYQSSLYTDEEKSKIGE